MSKNQIITWTTLFIAVIAWNFFEPYVSSLIYYSLTNIGVPFPIVGLILMALPIILLWEVVAKFLLWQAIAPLKFISTQAEEWTKINQDELNRYTLELERLGFVRLNDYTVQSSQSMARLFAHPEKFCFAEVGQVSNLPMFCSISCALEKHWVLVVTNISANRIMNAISYAFQRQPRLTIKKIDNGTINLIFDSLLDWREQVANDLGLKLIQDVSAETFFKRDRNVRINQRRSLLRKSIIWALLEMLWFYFNPKSEWLGDYSKKARVRK